MTKKKSTRNHSLMAIETKEPFTIEHARTLATTFKFKKTEQESYLRELTCKLNHAVKIYYRMENAGKAQPRLSEQKNYMNEILEASGKLIILLKNMGSIISFQLMRSIPNNKKKPVSSVELEARLREVGLKDRLKTDLRELRSRASIANKNIPIDNGGNPSDDVNQLIWSLADIYESETGLKAEVKHKSTYGGTKDNKDIYIESYCSDFCKFLWKVVNIINKSKQLIEQLPKGRTIQAILKRRKEETKVE